MRDFAKGFLACLLLLAIVLAIMYAMGRAAHGASVSLLWEQSPSPSVIGDAAYWWSLGMAPSRKDVGLATNCLITDLVAGRTYSFYVTAYDANHQESDPSNTIDYTPPTGTVTVREGPEVTGPWYQKFSSPLYPTNQVLDLVLIDLVSPAGGVVAILRVDGAEWWREVSADPRRFYKLEVTRE